MKPTSSWRTYTVETLFSRFNWEGTPPKPTQTPVSQTPKPQKVNWKCWTVEEFFSRNNWEGLAKPRTAYTRLQKPTTLNLQLPVAAFFEQFSWEARPQIGQLPNLETPVSASEKSQDIKLTDLSQLF